MGACGGDKAVARWSDTTRGGHCCLNPSLHDQAAGQRLPGGPSTEPRLRSYTSGSTPVLCYPQQRDPLSQI